MRAVVQRVSGTRVEVEGAPVGEIGRGLLVYLGVGKGDGQSDAEWMASKIANLRIFSDQDEKMNRSVVDEGGAVLVVSQFTLYADARKGRRPSYSEAAEPIAAKALYEQVVDLLRSSVASVATGEFQASMQVHSIVDGPVTILLDSSGAF